MVRGRSDKQQSNMQTPRTKPANDQGSALDNVPEEELKTNIAKPPKRTRAWCVIRIEDYRLTALAPADPEYPSDDLEYAELGGETYLSTDREEAFQNARTFKGLLVSSEGLPGVRGCTAFRDAARKMLGQPF